MDKLDQLKEKIAVRAAIAKQRIRIHHADTDEQAILIGNLHVMMYLAWTKGFIDEPSYSEATKIPREIASCLRIIGGTSLLARIKDELSFPQRMRIRAIILANYSHNGFGQPQIEALTTVLEWLSTFSSKGNYTYVQVAANQ